MLNDPEAPAELRFGHERGRSADEQWPDALAVTFSGDAGKG